MKWLRIGSAGLLMFSLVACDSLDELTDLEVINQNNPDRDRAIATATDVEALISSAFNISWDGMYGGYPSEAFMAAADEGTYSWGNFGVQQLSSEPRVEWPNTTTWGYRNVVQYPWGQQYEALSSVYDGLMSIMDPEKEADLCAKIDCDRAKAFAKFVQGMALGYLALEFDSAFIFDEVAVPDLQTAELELKPYPNIMAKALEYYAEAISLAQGKSWQLEQGWIPGNPYTANEFIGLVNSMRARYVTQVARTPAEHANLAGLATWNDVINWVDNGIDDDVFIDGDGAVLWWHSMIWYACQTWNSTWTRADYKTIGWTEISEGTGTGYQNWLNTPVAQRTEFLLQVPDERIQAAVDDTSAGLYFWVKGPSTFRADRGIYHYSMYQYYRYEDYSVSGGQTPQPHMLKATQDLIKAEALLNTGQTQAAVDIINASRVTRGGLPAATAADADLMDKLMYEYRIENFIVCPGCAFYTRRHWGPLAPTGPAHHQGLVEGTPLHMPIPARELQLLQKLEYSYGGVGYEGGALQPSAASGVGESQGTTVPARFIYAFNGLDTPGEILDHIRSRPNRLSEGVSQLTRHAVH